MGIKYEARSAKDKKSAKHAASKKSTKRAASRSIPAYIPPPKDLPGFPDLRQVLSKTGIPGDGLRRRWKDAQSNRTRQLRPGSQPCSSGRSPTCGWRRRPIGFGIDRARGGNGAGALHTGSQFR
jgi:hypothetical protein